MFPFGAQAGEAWGEARSYVRRGKGGSNGKGEGMYQHNKGSPMLLADVQEPMTVLRDRPENHFPLNNKTQVI